MDHVNLANVHVDQARYELDRLIQAVRWVHWMRIPGPQTRPTVPMSDETRRHLDAQVAAERADRAYNARNGYGALAPAPAPIRLGITVAETRIAADLHALCVHIAHHVESSYLGRSGIVAALNAAVTWLAGDPNPTASPTGLDLIRDEDLAEHAMRTLGRIGHYARVVAGIPDQFRAHLAAPCPACGRHSLYGDHTHRDGDAERRREPTMTDARHWYVVCTHGWDVPDDEAETGIRREWCRCLDPACGCRRQRRGHGDRHLWRGPEVGIVWQLSQQPAEVAA